jgi:hypothetical protein
MKGGMCGKSATVSQLWKLDEVEMLMKKRLEENR